MTALRDEASLPRKILLFCGLQKNKSQSPRLESRLEFVVTHTKKVCVFLTKITIFFYNWKPNKNIDLQNMTKQTTF